MEPFYKLYLPEFLDVSFEALSISGGFIVALALRATLAFTYRNTFVYDGLLLLFFFFFFCVLFFFVCVCCAVHKCICVLFLCFLFCLLGTF